MSAPCCRNSAQHGACRKIQKKHRTNNLYGSNATEINKSNLNWKKNFTLQIPLDQLILKLFAIEFQNWPELARLTVGNKIGRYLTK